MTSEHRKKEILPIYLFNKTDFCSAVKHEGLFIVSLNLDYGLVAMTTCQWGFIIKVIRNGLHLSWRPLELTQTQNACSWHAWPSCLGTGLFCMQVDTERLRRWFAHDGGTSRGLSVECQESIRFSPCSVPAHGIVLDHSWQSFRRIKYPTNYCILVRNSRLCS